jgi:hypothetical protein
MPKYPKGTSINQNRMIKSFSGADPVVGIYAMNFKDWLR